MYFKDFPNAGVRIHLPVEGTQVQSLVQEDAVKHLSPCATTTEICVPRACALQQKKPSQWKAMSPQRRALPLEKSSFAQHK